MVTATKSSDDLIEAAKAIHDELKDSLLDDDDLVSVAKAIRDEITQMVEQRLKDQETRIFKTIASELSRLQKLLESLPVPRVEVNVPENAIKIEQSTPQVTIPENSIKIEGVTVNVPETKVNVTTPEVTVNVPKQDAPIVNVTTPEVTVNVPETKVNVTTPEVTVNAPDVTVNVPKQDASIVNVKVPEPRLVKKKIEYDAYGRPTEITEENA